jgi:hypothetical protein
MDSARPLRGPYEPSSSLMLLSTMLHKCASRRRIRARPCLIDRQIVRGIPKRAGPSFSIRSDVEEAGMRLCVSRHCERSKAKQSRMSRRKKVWIASSLTLLANDGRTVGRNSEAYCAVHAASRGTNPAACLERSRENAIANSGRTLPRECGWPSEKRMSFRARQRREPGIHTPSWWLWIPGSKLRLAPE